MNFIDLVVNIFLYGGSFFILTSNFWFSLLEKRERNNLINLGYVVNSNGIALPDSNGEYIVNVVAGVHNRSDGHTEEIFLYALTNTGRKIKDKNIAWKMAHLRLPGQKHATFITYPINHPDGVWINDVNN